MKEMTIQKRKGFVGIINAAGMDKQGHNAGML
jgi:hypothetical protein